LKNNDDACLEKTPSKLNFDLDHLSNEHKIKVKHVLKEYKSLFSAHKLDLGLAQSFTHHIDTGNNSPISGPIRRVPISLENKVDNLIQNLLDEGIIRPSDSPWCAPIVAVAKKDGSVRLCIDYRQLNRITQKSVFPIPQPQHLFDCLKGSMFFSTLDLSSGYYQVGLSDENSKKTAFGTRMGQFEFTRMPFGLCNAPATFQKMMTTVLQSENWEKCLIYLDDVLVFGRTFEEHLERLKLVFSRLKEAGLKLSPGKCKLFQKEVNYLGHVVSPLGITADKEKTIKIKSWPRPSTADNLRTFLGLAGYYRNHIKNFSNLSSPLEKLASTKDPKQRKNLIWTSNSIQSFEELKIRLSNPPILGFPNEKGKFILDTDASNTAIGAVLSQIHDGKEVVLAYGSRSLSNSEKNYCVTRKELLSVHYFVKKYKHYLYGKHFLIRTDHKPLTWLLTSSNPKTSQYCRWKVELESYNFDCEHRSGINHCNADALSRYPECKQCDLKHPKELKFENVFNLELLDESETRKKIALFHSQLGHVGESKIYSVLKDEIKCLNLRKSVHEVLKRCQACQYYKLKNPRDKADMLYVTTNQPLERIAIDICGPLPGGTGRLRFVLGIVDYFSKFVVLVPLASVDAHTVARAIFSRWIAIFGPPKFIHTDRGTVFESAVMKSLCSQFKIMKTRTCPYYPQSDGLIERIFRTIKPLLCLVAYERHSSWTESIPYVELGLRCSEQATTKHSPFEILFGRKMLSPETNTAYTQNERFKHIKNIISIVQNNLKQAALKQAKRFNANTYSNEIKIGDKVLIKDFLSKFPNKKFYGPYCVTKKLNPSTFVIKDNVTGKEFQRHYSQIKRYYRQSESTITQVAETTCSFSNRCYSDKRTLRPCNDPDSHSPASTLRRSKRATRPPERFF